jgi:hypothetical protein
MSDWTDESLTSGFEFDFDDAAQDQKDVGNGPEYSKSTDPSHASPFRVGSVKFEDELAVPKLPPIRCRAKTACLYRWDINVKNIKIGPGECAVVWNNKLDQISPAWLDLSVGMIHAYDGVYRFVPAKNWDPRSLPSLETLRNGEHPNGDFPLGNVGGLHRISANPVPGFLLYGVSLDASPMLCARHTLTGNQMAKAVSFGKCHFDWVAPRLWVVEEGDGNVKDIVSGKNMKILLDLPCPMSIYDFEQDMDDKNLAVEMSTAGDLWGNLRAIMRRYPKASLALGGMQELEWFGLDVSDNFKFGQENASALNQIRLAAMY